MVIDVSERLAGRDSMRNIKPKKTTTLMTDRRLTDSIDYVLPNTHISRHSASLSVFEDDDAVFKMIIKGQCPSMRRISQTHRVNLDWLFDRINVDRGIRLKYVNTSKQIADKLTKRLSLVKDGRSYTTVNFDDTT